MFAILKINSLKDDPFICQSRMISKKEIVNQPNRNSRHAFISIKFKVKIAPGKNCIYEEISLGNNGIAKPFLQYGAVKKWRYVIKLHPLPTVEQVFRAIDQRRLWTLS